MASESLEAHLIASGATVRQTRRAALASMFTCSASEIRDSRNRKKAGDRARLYSPLEDE
jgi:hypothetical protein